MFNIWRLDTCCFLISRIRKNPPEKYESYFHPPVSRPNFGAHDNDAVSANSSNNTGCLGIKTRLSPCTVIRTHCGTFFKMNFSVAD